MSFAVVIPARYASTRLPGKPLLDIAGKPMIQRVYEQAQLSAAQRVIVATDDQRIATVVSAFGGEVCMTAASHRSGTDRLQEVVSQLGLADDAILVNVQGDEPLIPPSAINQVASLLQTATGAGIATLSEPITDLASLLNPNIVKVVTDTRGQALYFSRAPVPWPRDAFADSIAQQGELPTGVDFQRHIGIYAYRAALLNDFVRWPPSILEQAESLEQLRAMSQGAKIAVAVAEEAPPAGVDTLADLEQVRQLFV